MSRNDGGLNMTKATIQQLLENFSYNHSTGVLTRIKHVRGKYKIGDVMGTLNSDGYLSVCVNTEKLLVHRLVWAMHYGKWPDKWLDHCNWDKTDNRIENLREATPSENQRNRKTFAQSGLKGVTKLPNGSYFSQISKDGKNCYLGTFPTADEAAHAYNKFVARNFGEFAVLNLVGCK